MIGKYDFLKKYLLIRVESRINRKQFHIRLLIIGAIYLNVFFLKISHLFDSIGYLNLFIDIALLGLIYPFFVIFLKRIRDLNINTIFPGILFLLLVGFGIGFLFISHFFDINYIQGTGESIAYHNAFLDFFRLIGLSLYKIICIIPGIPLCYYLFNCFFIRGSLTQNRYGQPNDSLIGAIG